MSSFIPGRKRDDTILTETAKLYNKHQIQTLENQQVHLEIIQQEI
jgi:hypothetical protein